MGGGFPGVAETRKEATGKAVDRVGSRVRARSYPETSHPAVLIHIAILQGNSSQEKK
jgi:hypothetical protein